MVPYCLRNQDGFTLTEMMLVLIIGGILTAIAIPAFMNWAPKYRANGAARQIFSEMMAARAKAISESNDYVISFNTGSNTFTIHDNDDSDNPPVQDAGEDVRTIDIAAGYPGIEFGYTVAKGADTGNAVTFSGTPPRVRFMRSGLATTGTVYLMPKDSTRLDRQRCITVSLTGRVRLYKYTGSGWE